MFNTPPPPSTSFLLPGLPVASDYRKENARRKHNYVPFAVALMSTLAEKVGFEAHQLVDVVAWISLIPFCLAHMEFFLGQLPGYPVSGLIPRFTLGFMCAEAWLSAINKAKTLLLPTRVDGRAPFCVQCSVPPLS